MTQQQQQQQPKKKTERTKQALLMLSKKHERRTVLNKEALYSTLFAPHLEFLHSTRSPATTLSTSEVRYESQAMATEPHHRRDAHRGAPIEIRAWFQSPRIGHWSIADDCASHVLCICREGRIQVLILRMLFARDLDSPSTVEDFGRTSTCTVLYLRAEPRPQRKNMISTNPSAKGCHTKSTAPY